MRESQTYSDFHKGPATFASFYNLARLKSTMSVNMIAAKWRISVGGAWLMSSIM